MLFIVVSGNFPVTGIEPALRKLVLIKEPGKDLHIGIHLQEHGFCGQPCCKVVRMGEDPFRLVLNHRQKDPSVLVLFDQRDQRFIRSPINDDNFINLLL